MQVFKDPVQDEQFKEDGFVVIENLLTPEEVRLLAEFYASNPLPQASGFHATSHSKDVNYKRKVHEIITSVVRPKTTDILIDHRSVTSSFTVKEIGPETYFDYHLDWSMLDEHKYSSLTLWSPLIDTNRENGNLNILKSSHKLGFTIRSGPGLYLFSFDKAYKHTKFKPVELMLRTGDAVIWDHRVFHSSSANMSAERRVSFNHVLFPADAVAMHFTMIGKRKLNRYEVDDDFFNRYEIGELPQTGKLVETMKVPHRHINQPQINMIIDQ